MALVPGKSNNAVNPPKRTFNGQKASIGIGNSGRTGGSITFVGGTQVIDTTTDTEIVDDYDFFIGTLKDLNSIGLGLQ